MNGGLFLQDNGHPDLVRILVLHSSLYIRRNLATAQVYGGAAVYFLPTESAFCMGWNCKTQHHADSQHQGQKAGWGVLFHALFSLCVICRLGRQVLYKPETRLYTH